jgi:hypothetical protein
MLRNAAFALDHNLSSIGSSRGNQGHAPANPFFYLRPNPFGPGPGLTETAPGQN